MSVLFAPAARAEEKALLLDRILVIVEEGIVMESELTQREEEAARRLKQSGTTLPPRDLLQRQVMEQLIVESLMLQMAERQGVQVSDDELTDTLGRIAVQNDMTLEAFVDRLEQEGESFDNFRRNLRRNLTMQKVQQARVAPRINITEEEIDWFLKSNEGESLLNREYLVHHIMLPFDDDQEAALAEAHDLLRQMEQGEKFESLAVAHSAARNALEGGSLGWRKFNQLPSIIAEQVGKISTGTVTGPVSDGYSWHLVRLTDRRGDTVRYTDQWQLRHILMRPTAIRDAETTRTEIDQLRRRIEQGEDFSSLANLYSDDPNSALTGGDLGWIELNQVPPEFGDTIRSIEVGRVSETIRTEAGWHILQVLDKRNTDLTEETGRSLAHRLLHERKYEEALERFMHESRTQAYVEFKSGLAQQIEP